MYIWEHEVCSMHTDLTLSDEKLVSASLVLTLFRSFVETKYQPSVKGGICLAPAKSTSGPQSFQP